MEKEKREHMHCCKMQLKQASNNNKWNSKCDWKLKLLNDIVDLLHFRGFILYFLFGNIYFIGQNENKAKLGLKYSQYDIIYFFYLLCVIFSIVFAVLTNGTFLWRLFMTVERLVRKPRQQAKRLHIKIAQKHHK